MGKLLAAWLLLAAAVSPASATSPTEVVQAAVEQVIRVVQDADLAGPAASERRHQEIQRIVDNLFDFPEMTRRCLARHWTDRTAQEREEFIGLFKGMLEHLYFGRIENYSGQRMLYLSETIDGDYATVRAKVILSQKNELSVDYRLHLAGSRWAVYDVVIEGFSIVSTYRAQFNRTIQLSSYDHLVEKMRLKELELTTREQSALAKDQP
jgi:phospholipid transport system substrate-binding protein